MSVPASFKHLVGAKQNTGRVQVNAQQMSSLEIYNELEFCGLYNGQSGRAFAAQNPVCIGRKREIGCTLVSPVTQKSAGITILAPSEHRGQPLCHGELRYLGPVHHRDRVRENK